MPPRNFKKKHIDVDISNLSRLIPYTGGKNRYAKKIIPLFPKHDCYVEPFCGSLAVLFQKQKSKTEVVNDLDHELINFYRVIRENSEEFKRMIHFTPYSRELYNSIIKESDGSNQIVAAWKFFLIKRMGWTNKPAKDTIRIDTKGSDPILLHRIETYLWAFAERLNSIYLECKNYDAVIRQWDREYTFFYCDPPYFGTEDMYGKVFSKDDHKKLHYTLKHIKGKCMISYYDDPFIQDLYYGWNKKTFELKSRGGKTTNTEVIYCNFNITNKQLTLF